VVGSWSLGWLLAELIILVVTFPTIARLIRSIRPTAGLEKVVDRDLREPRISVVIPARNEADRIGPLLDSLASAPGIIEVIVVDDDSTDGTARVAQAHGAVVVSSPSRPNGWVGKTWALQQGIVAARGEWIVSLDADTRPSPVLPESMVQWAEEREATLTTVAGSFECPTTGAQLIHPALLTTLIYRYGRPGAVGDGRVIANGQCMVFRKDDAIGMHFMERVRGELIEDVALARSLVQEGRNVMLVDGAGLLRVRMFEDFSSTVRGWGRSISLAGIESHSRLLGQLVAVACSQVLPIVFIISGSAPVMGSLLLAIRIGTLVGAASSYPQRKWSFWLSPVADVLAWSIVARGVIRHFAGAPVVWRGRTYGPSRSSL